jgi:arylsulfatase A-like enzyme
MAMEGLKLTDFYVAASVCTPSRAGLMTGRLPIRSGMSGDKHDRVLYPNADGGLPPGEITVAEALKERGYATALVGKWHLGDGPDYMPMNQGFDVFYGIPYSNDMNIAVDRPRHRSGMDPNADFEWWDVPLMRGSEVIERPVNQNTLTQRYTEEALAFIEQNQERPFFLYLAHSMPHVPLFASDDFRNKSSRGRYGDTIEEIDWSVGQVLSCLRSHGIAERTLVVFTSDNGPWLKKEIAGGSAGLLRDGKGGTWEGGYRVPGIVWWPGRISPGRVSGEIASQLDLFTTSVLLAGGEIPVDREIDGVDLRALFFGTGPSPRDRIHYYRGDELYAIRKGPFKAHFQTWDGYTKVPEKAHDPALLIELGKDPAEQFDVSAKHPDVVRELTQAAEAHRESVIPGKPQFYEGTR